MSANRYATLAEAVELLVDPRTGVLKHLQQLRAEPSHPAFFHAVAEAADTGAFAPQRNFAYSGGAALTAEGAAAKATGEAVERYCAALYRKDEMPFTSAEGADFDLVPPASFTVHAPDQFEAPDFDLALFDETIPVHWAEAVCPLTGARAHVPAAAVYLPWTFVAGRGEAPILQPVSSGLACHGSFEAAAAGAICELVERDAFTLVWQACLAPPRLETDSLGAAHRDMIGRLGRAGYAVDLFSIGNDVGIAAVLAIARHDAPGGPGVVVSAAAASNPPEAVHKALEELPHTARYVMTLKAAQPERAGRLTAAEVTGQDDHLVYWAGAGRAADLAFLFANPARVPLDSLPDHRAASPAQELAALCRSVGRAGHRVWVSDITTPDIAAVGLVVVRALAPGLHPLVFGHARRALGGRLATVPGQLEWPAEMPVGARDNPLPHPFP